MFKKIISVVLVVTVVFLLASCNNSSDLIEENPQNTVIGFISGSSGEIASKLYASDGAQLIGYNTLSDLLLAVENNYVNYGIISDYEYVQAVNAERKIKIHKECDYKIDYCAYFRNDSMKLRDEFNASLKSMKEKGILDKIKDAEYKGITYHSSYTGSGENALTVLCNPTVDLYFYLLAEGIYSGIDVKILETFAEEKGYSIQYVANSEDDELFYKLKNGEGDMLISDYTYNSKRAEQYLISDTYFTMNFYLVTRKSV